MESKEVYIVYENLAKELQRKKITNAAVARLLNCNEKTFYNKLHGNTEFSLNEGFLIHRNLLPEFNLDYLFHKA